MRKLVGALTGLLVFLGLMPFAAWAATPALGIVIMHGKGGAPTRLVLELASALEGKGYLVANIEMPWSGRRNYDADVARAEQEVDSAVALLRSGGAARVFVAGHSQGGAFALYLAGKYKVDGIVAIAPGGDVSGRIFRNALGESVAMARRLVAEGKGDERTRLQDFEGSRGSYPIVTSPRVYLTWFDPEGAMNMTQAARAANPEIPILWIVPTRDYPGLRRVNIPMFDLLPRNPRTTLLEPDSDHRGAPSAAMDGIVQWTRQVAGIQ